MDKTICPNCHIELGVKNHLAEHLKSENADLKRHLGIEQERIAILMKDMAVLKEVLKFYADVENWHRYLNGKRVYEHPSPDILQSAAVMDYGKRAARVLDETKEETKS